MIRAMLLALLCTAVAAQAPATDHEWNRSSLKGLSGVHVLVEDFRPGQEKAGFDPEAFKKGVELKLRVAGIPTLPEEDRAATGGVPVLYLRVNALHNVEGEKAAFGVALSLQQVVRLRRDPSVELPAETWSVGSTGEARLVTILRHTQKLTDLFIDAWFSVNPKK